MKKLLLSILLMSAFNVGAMTFKVVNDGEVGAYFVGANAGYENRMTANFSDPTMDAPFISNRSATGSYFSFGNHLAGSDVVFVNNVIDTGDWFYSITDFNDDSLPHMLYSSFNLFAGTPRSIPVLLIGFEDIYGLGDRDFNDNVVLFTNISAAVPEPSTYIMLLFGLLLIMFFFKHDQAER